MILILNKLRFRLFWILALYSSISTGTALQCFNCHYAAGFDLSAVLDLSSTPENWRCNNPDTAFAPNGTCNSNEPTCEKRVMTITVNSSVLEMGTDLRLLDVRLSIRKCSEESLPNQGDRCRTFTEKDDKWSALSSLAKTYLQAGTLANETFSINGSTCLCDKDNCNNQPGLKDNDEGYVRTTTTDQPNKASDTQTCFCVIPFMTLFLSFLL